MRDQNKTDVIRLRGVLSKGYGQLPKIIMTAPLLSLEAKGLYAYFASFTGSGCNRKSTGTVLNDSFLLYSLRMSQKEPSLMTP